MSFMNIFNQIKNNKGIVFLFTMLLFIVGLSFFLNVRTFEGFSGYNLANPGKYPNSETEPLLKDSYKLTGKKDVSEKSYSDVWWHYPIFGVGSYAQITNNLKYRRNPDEGTCIRADFCGALYEDKHVTGNISKPLPPAPFVSANSVRVNYYTTNSNLIPGQPLGPELQAF
jgi:hypothetical protein